MQYNMIASYVDAHTGVLLYTEPFYDPDLKWVKRGKEIHLYKSWGCGKPTEEWFINNPIPK